MPRFSLEKKNGPDVKHICIEVFFRKNSVPTSKQFLLQLDTVGVVRTVKGFLCGQSNVFFLRNPMLAPLELYCTQFRPFCSCTTISCVLPLRRVFRRRLFDQSCVCGCAASSIIFVWIVHHFFSYRLLTSRSIPIAPAELTAD